MNPARMLNAGKAHETRQPSAPFRSTEAWCGGEWTLPTRWR
jgi:hypothetical protein